MKQTLFGLVIAMGITAGVMAGAATSQAQVSQSTSNAWPAKWCRALPGISGDELIAIMGPYTNHSPTTMTWQSQQLQFNAFFDSNGKVRQLDINVFSHSEAEKAALPCEIIRTRATVARAAANASAKPHKIPAACTLVTAAEMSTILGTPVVAVERKDGNTECNYAPASGSSPAVKLSVDWGDGKIAMASAGFMGKREPGLTSPYEGIGDQAVAVGPALMIRTGEDLMTIVFTGVTGAPAKARRIFDTAKPRM